MLWIVYTKFLGSCSTCERVAGHSCIFRVQTVVFPPGTFWTLLQSELIARATHLVQQHVTWTLAKMCLAPGPCCTATKDIEARKKALACVVILIQWKTDTLTCAFVLSNVDIEWNNPIVLKIQWHRRKMDTQALAERVAKYAYLCGTRIHAGTMSLIHCLTPRCSLLLACSSLFEWKEYFSFSYTDRWRDTRLDAHTSSC